MDLPNFNQFLNTFATFDVICINLLKYIIHEMNNFHFTFDFKNKSQLLIYSVFLPGIV